MFAKIFRCIPFLILLPILLSACGSSAFSVEQFYGGWLEATEQRYFYFHEDGNFSVFSPLVVYDKPVDAGTFILMGHTIFLVSDENSRDCQVGDNFIWSELEFEDENTFSAVITTDDCAADFGETWILKRCEVQELTYSKMVCIVIE